MYSDIWIVFCLDIVSSPIFLSWVTSLETKWQDFTAQSFHPRNSMISSVFRVETDYVGCRHKGIYCKMGYESLQTRCLKTDEVSSLHAEGSMLAELGLRLYLPSCLLSPGKLRALHQKGEVNRVSLISNNSYWQKLVQDRTDLVVHFHQESWGPPMKDKSRTVKFVLISNNCITYYQTCWWFLWKYSSKHILWWL